MEKRTTEDENDFTGLCCGELLDGYQLEDHIKRHHREIPADVVVVTVHGVNVSHDANQEINVNNNNTIGQKAKNENTKDESDQKM